MDLKEFNHNEDSEFEAWLNSLSIPENRKILLREAWKFGVKYGYKTGCKQEKDEE
jgi:hypothetical protein